MNTKNLKNVGIFIAVVGLALNLVSTESVLYILVTYQINLLLMIVGIALMTYSNIKTYKTINAKRAEKLTNLHQVIKTESN